MAKQFDVAVIGAGAAGMMCAAVAAQRGKRVVLIDHAEKLAEKIRISGGGRCNFTNINTTPQNFLSDNPHFCKSALSRYTPRSIAASCFVMSRPSRLSRCSRRSAPAAT
jgi:predicted flavoprotein YhiN